MVEQFDLSVARDRVGLPTSFANPMAAVTVAVLPVGFINVRLHFGHGDQGRVVTQEGQTFEPDPADNRNGLFLSNDIGVGVLVLDVSFVTFREPVPVVDVTRTPRTAPAGGFVDQLLRNFGLRK